MSVMRWRDSWIPWLFVGGFAITIAANGIMVFYAVDSFTGLATEDHYEKGLRYNEALAATARQDARGWSVGVETTALGGAGYAVALTLNDRDGAPLTGADVTARFVRPTHAGHDVDAVLVERGVGRYGAEVDLPMKGQWDIRLSITHPQGTHLETQRAYLR